MRARPSYQKSGPTPGPMGSGRVDPRANWAWPDPWTVYSPILGTPKPYPFGYSFGVLLHLHNETQRMGPFGAHSSCLSQPLPSNNQNTPIWMCFFVLEGKGHPRTSSNIATRHFGRVF